MSNKSFSFGDPVTNICAGENSPMRHTYYVRRKDGNIEVTNKKGRFWLVLPEVIKPGHLGVAESTMLFQPIWQKRYGKIAHKADSNE